MSIIKSYKLFEDNSSYEQIREPKFYKSIFPEYDEYDEDGIDDIGHYISQQDFYGVRKHNSIKFSDIEYQEIADFFPEYIVIVNESNINAKGYFNVSLPAESISVLSDDGFEVSIVKTGDEWFYLLDHYRRNYYKCDQITGVFSLLRLLRKNYFD